MYTTNVSRRRSCRVYWIALTVVGVSGWVHSAMAAAPPVHEVVLASPAQGLAFCQSGKQPSNSISYISGISGLAQFGPAYSCAQKVVTSADAPSIFNALYAEGRKVRQCRLATRKQAVTLCKSGGIQIYDIDYYAGAIGSTVNGPGYRCGVNMNPGPIGGAVCK